MGRYILIAMAARLVGWLAGVVSGVALAPVVGWAPRLSIAAGAGAGLVGGVAAGPLALWGMRPRSPANGLESDYDELPPAD